ncbi:hypothetical protein [Occallatibacter riparius]|uniref:Uncharacterized protein n=1 Tax=Occallatibacter riparius TaxID=1002689 RepID=A0A9J7BUH7_9BACT|nr:hypothetical protein [Occallatibacter riparius]UWZ84653.1 hypothetical protein MOP44_01660 [Occallatibacter riparius]
MRIGLSEEEFFGITPRMYIALCDEWKRQEREKRTMWAQLRTDIINFSMRGPADPVRVSDILPDPDTKPRARGRWQSKKRLAEGLMAVFERLAR